jgi:hypothetical protein
MEQIGHLLSRYIDDIYCVSTAAWAACSVEKGVGAGAADNLLPSHRNHVTTNSDQSPSTTAVMG